jgi:hypothetical protein
MPAKRELERDESVITIVRASCYNFLLHAAHGFNMNALMEINIATAILFKILLLP